MANSRLSTLHTALETVLLQTQPARHSKTFIKPALHSKSYCPKLSLPAAPTYTKLALNSQSRCPKLCLPGS